MIPRGIIEQQYFRQELDEIEALVEHSGSLESELDDMREEESGEEGLLKGVLNDKGDGIPKANLNKRIKELEDKKTSPAIKAMVKIAAFFDEGKTAEIKKVIAATAELSGFDLQNKSGSFTKAKIKAALKAATDDATMPEAYQDEYDALMAYAAKSDEKDAVDSKLKKARKVLDEKVEKQYGELTVDEIKRMLFDLKWMAKVEADIQDEIDQVVNDLSARVQLIARRYEHTLGEIEGRTERSRSAVMSALERMGYTW